MAAAVLLGLQGLHAVGLQLVLLAETCSGCWRRWAADNLAAGPVQVPC